MHINLYNQYIAPVVHDLSISYAERHQEIENETVAKTEVITRQAGPYASTLMKLVNAANTSFFCGAIYISIFSLRELASEGSISVESAKDAFIATIAQYTAQKLMEGCELLQDLTHRHRRVNTLRTGQALSIGASAYCLHHTLRAVSPLAGSVLSIISVSQMFQGAIKAIIYSESGRFRSQGISKYLVIQNLTSGMVLTVILCTNAEQGPSKGILMLASRSFGAAGTCLLFLNELFNKRMSPPNPKIIPEKLIKTDEFFTKTFSPIGISFITVGTSIETGSLEMGILSGLGMMATVQMLSIAKTSKKEASLSKKNVTHLTPAEEELLTLIRARPKQHQRTLLQVLRLGSTAPQES